MIRRVRALRGQACAMRMIAESAERHARLFEPVNAEAAAREWGHASDAWGRAAAAQRELAGVYGRASMILVGVAVMLAGAALILAAAGV